MTNQSKMWNLWHGCHKLSAGCKYCYVYRGDAKRDIDSTIVTKTKNFDLPVQKKRSGEYKIPAGTLLYTCFTICVESDVSFWFKQTGAKFVKDGRLYQIGRKFQHSQARKAGINFKN